MANQTETKAEATPLTAAEKVSLQQARARRAINTAYVITTGGIEFLAGRDAEEVITKIESPDMDPGYYRFYDDQHRKWAYIAVRNTHGQLEPLTFPNPQQYGTTSPELYAKAVTYSTVLAQAIGLITKSAPSLWERIMKPTTVITAIIVVTFVIFILAVAMTG